MEKDGVMMKTRLTRSVLLFSALLLAGQTLASCGDSAVAGSVENTAPSQKPLSPRRKRNPFPPPMSPPT